ncbi:octopamine receptor Oamb-like [Actinia tenebrosa]|uniref:Octopamine receptor Oamb-like n=1 Tax=Actinia tenebrosa TaxID=6105 RepID=A0A6P8IH66_ACTTE|nr:octopamine receptor Oamb-like [Actinia tenebrosa]
MNNIDSQNQSLLDHNGSITTSSGKSTTGYYELIAISVLYGILLVAILAGNGLILASFVINKKLRTITNRLVVGLAISDVLVGLVSIPCWMYVFICQFKGITYNSWVYQFYIVFDIFIGSASILQLTAIGIERCHAVVRPFRHRTLPKRAFYVMVSVPWFYAGFVAVLQPVQYKSWREVYTILMTTTCFLGPLLINVLSYSCIVKFAHSKPRRNLTEQRIPNSVYRKEIKLAVTVALITALFVVAWLPLFVVTVIGTYHPQNLPSPVWSDRLIKFVKWMHYGNSAVDPFFYAYRNKDIILTFRFIVLRLFCRKVTLMELHHVTGCNKGASTKASIFKNSCHKDERKPFHSVIRISSSNNNEQSTV